MGTRPSDSSSGQAWLANFTPEDRVRAAQLLNSLRIVGETTFRSSLADLVLAAVDRSEGPVGLYAVTDVPKVVLPGEEFPPPIGEPDSSSLVANLLRSIEAMRPDKTLFNVDVETLHTKRARTILLVDDYTGSGGQASRYIARWMSHPRIRSWMSFKWTRVEYVTYACSRSAFEKLSMVPALASIDRVWAGLTFDAAAWTASERLDIRDVCERYAFKRRYAHGYEDSEGLFLSQHTVPNNLPAILWQRNRGRKAWTPMFKNRQLSPSQADELLDYAPDIDASRLANELGQRALRETKSESAQSLLLLLALLAAGKRDDDRLASSLGMPVQRVTALVGAATQLGLCDSRRRLSNEGRAELRAAKTQPRPEPFALVENDEPYYPQYKLFSSARGSGRV
ncbi:MAG: hypothetical protein ACE37B_11800 [Ilumatobacter sp.]|uniref:phosphoribosyltransferase-like protein n=1 Tax=Ilumatobacter sp. TaxID=1967498 RepID=UPI00391C793D